MTRRRQKGGRTTSDAIRAAIAEAPHLHPFEFLDAPQIHRDSPFESGRDNSRFLDFRPAPRLLGDRGFRGGRSGCFFRRGLLFHRFDHRVFLGLGGLAFEIIQAAASFLDFVELLSHRKLSE